jgi:hypothetical protein
VLNDLIQFLSKDDIISTLNDLGLYPALNEKKLPKISYSKKDQLFVVSYNGPDDFGIQSYTFNYEDFIYAYQNSKFKHDTPKNSYSNFYELFFYRHPNAHVRIIFDLFSINPTILKQAAKIAKSRKKITIYPKPKKYQKFLNDLIFLCD